MISKEVQVGLASPLGDRGAAQAYRIQLSPPESTGREDKYLKEALDANRMSVYGDALDKFSQKLKQLTDSPHILLTNSGTSALHLALKCLNVSQGDRVICPTFAYAASAFPIKYLGAEPVFVDCDPKSWNLDPDLLESTISKLVAHGSQHPKAIIAVHNYGVPANMKAIMEVAAHYDIPVIEDAAEAIGSRIDDQHVGALGDLGVLSFNGNKIITSGGGGALLSNSKKHVSHAKKLAGQSKEDVPWYEHDEIGYNYQMGNLNAALGLGQLEKLDEKVACRRHNYEYYEKKLGEYELEFQMEPANTYSNRWLTCVLFQDHAQMESVRLALEASGIESKPLWKPLHLQPVFKGAKYFGDSISIGLFERGLCLPSGSGLREDQLQEIVGIIKETLQVYLSSSP